MLNTFLNVIKITQSIGSAMKEMGRSEANVAVGKVMISILLFVRPINEIWAYIIFYSPNW